MIYRMICYDDLYCEYGGYEVSADDWTHALQRLAAQMPDEPPKYIEVYAIDRNIDP